MSKSNKFGGQYEYLLGANKIYEFHHYTYLTLSFLLYVELTWSWKLLTKIGSVSSVSLEFVKSLEGDYMWNISIPRTMEVCFKDANQIISLLY